MEAYLQKNSFQQEKLATQRIQELKRFQISKERIFIKRKKSKPSSPGIRASHTHRNILKNTPKIALESKKHQINELFAPKDVSRQLESELNKYSICNLNSPTTSIQISPKSANNVITHKLNSFQGIRGSPSNNNKYNIKNNKVEKNKLIEDISNIKRKRGIVQINRKCSLLLDSMLAQDEMNTTHSIILTHQNTNSPSRKDHQFAKYHEYITNNPSQISKQNDIQNNNKSNFQTDIISKILKVNDVYSFESAMDEISPRQTLDISTSVKSKGNTNVSTANIRSKNRIKYNFTTPPNGLNDLNKNIPNVSTQLNRILHSSNMISRNSFNNSRNQLLGGNYAQTTLHNTINTQSNPNYYISLHSTFNDISPAKRKSYLLSKIDWLSFRPKHMNNDYYSLVKRGSPNITLSPKSKGRKGELETMKREHAWIMPQAYTASAIPSSTKKNNYLIN